MLWLDLSHMIYVESYSLLSRRGCHEVPSPLNLPRLVVEVSKHEFIAKPLRVLYVTNSGVPVPHMHFGRDSWLMNYEYYKELTPTTANVIRMIKELDTVDNALENALSYFIQMIWSMKQDELCNFFALCDRQ